MKIWLILICLFLLWPTLAFAVDDASVDPSENFRCWTVEVCEAKDKDGNPRGRFARGSDPIAEASKIKEVCGDNYGFCYPPANDFELSVSIPFTSNQVTSSVTDLGDYIDKAYKFILGFSMLFAVLMMMVGGLQYISSPGGQEVSKAKERITRSLTGLVLLMCATLILFTVNPKLISLDMPGIPKIRTSFFISDSTSCEDLISVGGYTIEPATGFCGESDGKIVAVNDMNITTEEQESCKWDTCQDSAKECVSPAVAGTPASCVGCLDLSSTSATKPSSETCSRLSPSDTFNEEGGLKIDNTCFFHDYIIAGPESCRLVALDCSSIKECSDYENVTVQGDDSSTLKIFATSSSSDYGLDSVCITYDPCNVGACKFDSTLLNECEADLTPWMAH